MKRGITLFIIGTALMALVACGGQENLDITYFRQVESVGVPTGSDDSLLLNTGLLEYDSVRFSDGSYAVHRLKYSPQNSLTEFFDSEGRTIATVARASECYAQALVYGYDTEGRLCHLVRFFDEMFDGLESDSANYGRDREGYLAFRRMIADFDYAHPDTTKRYEQTNIEYDKDGIATKAYVACDSDFRIVAPVGYRLEVAVRQCPYFWQSDVLGGYYIFHVTLEPKRRTMKEYRVCRYEDFLPTVETFYRNGKAVRTVRHGDERTSGRVDK